MCIRDRPYLDNQIGADEDEWPRALYVNMCRRELALSSQHYPSMALNCLYRAHMLDLKKLEAEVTKLPPADQKVVLAQSRGDVAELERVVAADFPKADNAREWEIFHDVPLRLRDEQRAREKDHAPAYAAMKKFLADAAKGEFKACEGPLKQELESYVGRADRTLPAAVERMSDPLGYALAESLARCYYYNERLEKASALLATLEQARRRVTLAEQIYYAQIDALETDAPGAEKFPNLVGKKYSSVRVGDVSGFNAYPDKLEEVWRRDRRTYAEPNVSEGRIAKIEKAADGGATVRFVKEKLPDMDLDCRETNEIERIDSDGKLVYRQDCTSRQKGWYWSAPSPVKVDDARGLAPGRFVRIAVRQDKGGVLACTQESGEKGGKLFRLADVAFE